MTARITYREACRQAIRDALLRDPRTFVMGEDVGRYGGCYGVTKGLLEEFGPERILDTPLAENGFVGVGVGAVSRAGRARARRTAPRGGHCTPSREGAVHGRWCGAAVPPYRRPVPGGAYAVRRSTSWRRRCQPSADPEPASEVEGPTSTIHGMPKRSVSMPNSSPHICFSSGIVILAPSLSPSQ